MDRWTLHKLYSNIKYHQYRFAYGETLTTAWPVQITYKLRQSVIGSIFVIKKCYEYSHLACDCRDNALHGCAPVIKIWWSFHGWKTSTQGSFFAPCIAFPSRYMLAITFLSSVANPMLWNPKHCMNGNECFFQMLYHVINEDMEGPDKWRECYMICLNEHRVRRPLHMMKQSMILVFLHRCCDNRWKHLNVMIVMEYERYISPDANSIIYIQPKGSCCQNDLSWKFCDIILGRALWSSWRGPKTAMWL